MLDSPPTYDKVVDTRNARHVSLLSFISSVRSIQLAYVHNRHRPTPSSISLCLDAGCTLLSFVLGRLSKSIACYAAHQSVRTHPLGSVSHFKNTRKHKLSASAYKSYVIWKKLLLCPFVLKFQPFKILLPSLLPLLMSTFILIPFRLITSQSISHPIHFLGLFDCNRISHLSLPLPIPITFNLAPSVMMKIARSFFFSFSSLSLSFALFIFIFSCLSSSVSRLFFIF